MLHLNDSKTPIGSNRDRHENIGEGEIGLEGFRAIVTSPALDGLPGILEVPGFDGEGPDAAQRAAPARPGGRLRMTGGVPAGRVVSAARTTNVVVASMWREILVANGIRAEVGGTAAATSVYAMMPMLSQIDVFVFEEDADRARELISQAESETGGVAAREDDAQTGGPDGDEGPPHADGGG